jgi:NADH-quinone oxidoreductase subunit D
MPEGNEYHANVQIIIFRKRRCLQHGVTIYHFKIVMGEVPVPVAEIYHPVEGGNGD